MPEAARERSIEPDPATSVLISFRGHADVRASDPQALEIVAGDVWAARPGAIGYAPQYDPQALQALRGRVSALLKVGDEETAFEATVSPLFGRGAPLVFRREPPAARLFAVQASKAAADLGDAMKAALRAPGAQATLSLAPMADEPMPAGLLVLVGMPIGSQGDLSPRALDVLSSVDVILAEDTRIAHAALAWRGVKTRLESCFAEKEALRTTELAERLKAGGRVAFISDAGMPTVSDPGAKLVRAAVAVGGAVTVIPGPSAVTVAMAASGLGGERFAFQGFPARKGEARRAQLLAVSQSDAPTVLFESPRRLLSLLEDLRALAPEREVAVCRDLTKRTEAVSRGSLAALCDTLAAEPEPRGEYAIVVAAAEPAAGPDPEAPAAADLDTFIGRLLDADCPAAPIVAALRASGAPRKTAYDLVQRLRDARTGA